MTELAVAERAVVELCSRAIEEAMRVLRRLTKSEPRVSCAVFLATGLALAQIAAATNARAADRVFTVGNYPVEAEAKNAVA
ncbi:MAG: hypothetical protein AAFQ44_09030, partial [Pseudomonadota bacterium]